MPDDDAGKPASPTEPQGVQRSSGSRVGSAGVSATSSRPAGTPTPAPMPEPSGTDLRTPVKPARPLLRHPAVTPNTSKAASIITMMHVRPSTRRDLAHLPSVRDSSDTGAAGTGVGRRAAEDDDNDDDGDDDDDDDDERDEMNEEMDESAPHHGVTATATATLVSRKRSASVSPPGSSAAKRRRALPEATPDVEAVADKPRRKDKSLRLLCTSFLDRYKGKSEIALDTAATELHVTRRRIYDVVNVLEGVSVVSRTRKNVYKWEGLQQLYNEIPAMIREAHDQQLIARISASAEREMTERFGLNEAAHPATPATASSAAAAAGAASLPGVAQEDTMDSRKDKSLILSARRFLQVILVVPKHKVALEEAARILMGSEQDDAKMLKTKVRRLYDIANILSSLNIIEKVRLQMSKKPAFQWTGEDLSAIDEYTATTMADAAPPSAPPAAATAATSTSRTTPAAAVSPQPQTPGAMMTSSSTARAAAAAAAVAVSSTPAAGAMAVAQTPASSTSAMSSEAASPMAMTPSSLHFRFQEAQEPRIRRATLLLSHQEGACAPTRDDGSSPDASGSKDAGYQGEVAHPADWTPEASSDDRVGALAREAAGMVDEAARSAMAAVLARLVAAAVQRGQATPGDVHLAQALASKAAAATGGVALEATESHVSSSDSLGAVSPSTFLNTDEAG